MEKISADNWKHGEPHHGPHDPHGGHEHHGWKHHMEKEPPMPEISGEQPKLPDESGWYLPQSPVKKSGDIMTARTGIMMTSAAVGIFVICLIMILVLAIMYRRRKMWARRQAKLVAAQRSLYIAGMGSDNLTYVVPLNDEEKKVPLDLNQMVCADDYPSLLTPTEPPSYSEATMSEQNHALPPSYSLEHDDTMEQVPVLRRLSITLPDEQEQEKKENDC